MADTSIPIVEFDVGDIHVHLVDGYPGKISYAPEVNLSATHPASRARDDRGALMTHEDVVLHELYRRHGGAWRVGPPEQGKDGTVSRKIWQE